MESTNYPHSIDKGTEREGKYENRAWWPLFALSGILGGLLLWEDCSPLPFVATQVVSFATLSLLFGGIALWLISLTRD